MGKPPTWIELVLITEFNHDELAERSDKSAQEIYELYWSARRAGKTRFMTLLAPETEDYVKSSLSRIMFESGASIDDIAANLQKHVTSATNMMNRAFNDRLNNPN